MTPPFEITDNAQGGKTGTNGLQSLVATEPECRVFRRRAVKLNGSGNVEWIVAELDGVRAYFDGHTVTVTRQDIYP